MSIFENTEVAFADKSNAELQKAYWMFKMIEQPALTRLGSGMLNKAIEWKLPFAGEVVKNTLFAQFVGGETREESLKIVDKLKRSGIGSIFDYSIEGKEDEATFDAVCREIQDIVKFAADKQSIPFIVFKPTAFGRIDLYEKVGAKAELTPVEEGEWERVVRRFDDVCSLCHRFDKKVMVDAEETWMQDAADALVRQMMQQYNREKPIVWNTIQLYRTGRLEAMQRDLEDAVEKDYYIGYKLVRGAYMEKERLRAAERGYPDPIQPTKAASDANYNAAVDFVFQHIDRVSAFFGTHNEISTKKVMDEMDRHHLAASDPRIYFGQLYGMSDNITYVLANMGYNATKYLPYGPVRDVVPYLTRRAAENTSVAGQTGRELSLITAELKRRRLK